MPGIAGTRLAQTRSNLALATRYKSDDVVADAKREHAEARLEAYIARVLADAPPLTPEQAARLAAMLRPTSGGGAS